MGVTTARKFARRLAAIPQKTRENLSKAIAQGADEITAVQKAGVPVDDGTLRNSITWQWGGDGIYKQLAGDAKLSAVIMAGGISTTIPVRKGVSASYDYALAQEFGTKKMAANPFFFPAYRLQKRRVKSRITRAMNKSIKEQLA